MTKSRLFVFFTLTFMVTLLSIGIWGQEISYYSDPWMQTPGFRPEMPYRSLSENESVNIFNGNLTAIIPVGPSFPCGPSLSFQARLRYVGPYSGIEGSFQDYYGTRQGDCGWSIDSNVAYRDNAGKWVLMFGKIHEKIVSSNDAFIVEFVEQDGTIHSFYKRDYDVEMGYTNDGSGIRLFRFPGANIRYVVYMPSGTIMEFGHGLTHNDGADYFVTKVSDRDGNSYRLEYEYTPDASYQLEAIIIDPTHPIIIGPIRDDLLPIKCTGGTPSGYSIPTQINVKVFTGQIAYISWDKGEYPAPYYRVFQRVSEPGQTLGQFVEIGVTDKSFFVYPGAPQPNEGELLAYSIQPLDEALNPVTNSSFAKLAEFISVTNTAPRPRNMSMGDGNRLVEVNWWGYATEGTQGPFGTSEPIAFDSESGLYYELLRGYNSSVTAMGCETFSLADFTLKQTTFEPYHEDTHFNATDETPLVAYKVRVNFEGNLPLPESECKWTHVGYCYDRPHVEWIHGYFTGNFNDDGAPIVTVEWAAAGPYSSTVYDLWRNGKYELYDITGTSITFAIGGHPDSTDVTHEFGVRAVNLPDGCLSDLVTCTVTVPGDVTTCPPQPGDILLMSSIVGPVYDENNELVGIKVQLVWSGETGSFIKIHRSFEECDQESPVIDTVSATQSCYYDTLQSGQIAYYYVESGRNNCPKVGESECLTVSVLPQTGLNEGTVYFYVKDHLGNTRLVLDGEGNIQSRMSYEPYGVELYPLAANASGEKYKFTNQERDYTTGLDYFHARYYSSAMGRFLRPDPIYGNPSNPQSWNLYSYVRNNPVNANDPSGLDSVIVIDETKTKEIEVKDAKGNTHTYKLYKATIYKETTKEEYDKKEISKKKTEEAYVGITADNENAKTAKKSAKEGEHFGKNMDTPPGTYDVTKSVGEKGKDKGWLMFNTPGEDKGVVKYNDIERKGMSIHPGTPDESEGCITSKDDFDTLKEAIKSDLDAEKPITLIVPNIYECPLMIAILAQRAMNDFALYTDPESCGCKIQENDGKLLNIAGGAKGCSGYQFSKSFINDDRKRFIFNKVLNKALTYEHVEEFRATINTLMPTQDLRHEFLDALYEVCDSSIWGDGHGYAAYDILMADEFDDGYGMTLANNAIAKNATKCNFERLEILFMMDVITANLPPTSKETLMMIANCGTMNNQNHRAVLGAAVGLARLGNEKEANEIIGNIEELVKGLPDLTRTCEEIRKLIKCLPSDKAELYKKLEKILL
ncbi:MAG TPA: RHS repeat-associated core domain-containing protein [Acidobacteriota bacterium]|nr:RHS repeat-associated core domain-containing protein [Acidobacteriota bacterium]